MSDSTTVTAATNTKPNSCVDVHCDCSTMWSMAQQFSTLRLSTKTADFKATLVKDYAVRARRISATYARFYLEQEEGGNLRHKGRYYWTALGAFASKTVACTLETWQLWAQSNVLRAKKTRDGLGKGNFWLFCDISGWHWYHSRYGSSFETCLEERNAANFVPAVKAQVAQLPWSAEALGKINQMRPSKYVREGFGKVKEFEQSTDKRKQPAIQMAHLLAIANHEQGVVLQPLIYEDPDFAWWVQAQRSAWVNWASPNLELIFTNACKSDAAELKSVAPAGTKLEDFPSRMTWITQAANKFHALMQKKTAQMEAELSVIAGWVDSPDA
jgi:hypothetical protein